MEEADLPYLINKKDREFYLPQLLKKCAAKLIANENLCSIQPHSTVKGTVEEKRGGSFSYEAEWSITALKEAPQTIKAHISILSAPSTADLNKLMESDNSLNQHPNNIVHLESQPNIIDMLNIYKFM